MSHIIEIKIPAELGVGTEFTDLDCLKAAAEILGGTFHEGRATYQTYGRWIGDTPPPADWNPRDMGKCDHCIQIPGAFYEIGVTRAGEGYRLFWDYFNSELKQKLGGEQAPKMAAAYAAAVRQKRTAEALRETARLKNLPTSTTRVGAVLRMEVRLP